MLEIDTGYLIVVCRGQKAFRVNPQSSLCISNHCVLMPYSRVLHAGADGLQLMKLHIVR